VRLAHGVGPEKEVLAAALRQVPARFRSQDGTIEDDKDTAEITGLTSRAGNWPEGLRWIAPALRTTTWQVNTGWVIAANIAADLTAWTSTDHPASKKGDQSGAVGAGRTRAPRAAQRDHHRQPNRHQPRNQTAAQSVSEPQAP
jgi:hypothetical protein